MPNDLLKKYLGDTCPKCGKEERAENQKWCTSCLTASQRFLERNAQAMWQEEYNYVPYAVRHPQATPLPSPFKPQGFCQKCGGAVWVDRGEGLWGCGGCGWNPSYPDQPKPV